MLPSFRLTYQGLLRAVGATAVAISLTGAAQAQDYRSWTGFYAGLHGGYHWGGSSSLSLLPDEAAWAALSPDYAQFDGRTGGTVDDYIAGGQIGYNWRAGGFIVGLEADISRTSAGTDVDRTVMVTEGLDTFPIRLQNAAEIDWLGTLRARIGVTPFGNDRVLVYVTGGLAYARVKTAHSFIDVDNASGYAGSSSGWEAGGTIGAGLEWGIGGGWTLKAEYLYYDLGDIKVHGEHVNNAAPPEFGTDAHYDLNGHIARLGVNYRIGGY